MASQVGRRVGMIGRPEFDTLVNGYNELAVAQTVNVKNFGAVGNGTTDDTAAFKAAIVAATKVGKLTIDGLQGFGGVVVIPPGIYKITSQIDLPDGVSLQGAGRRTSVIQFTLDNATDALRLVYPSQYGGRVFIRDLALQATGTRDKARDLLSIIRAGPVDVSNVNIVNGARYGIYVEDCIDMVFNSVRSSGHQSAAFYIGDSTIGSVNTSTRLYNCYFSNTATGPGASTTGTDVQFYSCLFESNGSGTDTTNGVGARVRSGQTSFYSCYFENNTWYDIHAGTVANTHLVVVNPLFISGGYASPIKSSIYCDKVTSGGIFGAKFTVHYRGLYMTTNCYQLNIFADPGPSGINNTNGIGTIEWAGGKLENYPGFLSIYDPATGEHIVVGRQWFSLGGGTPISKSETATKTWNPGTVADDAVASTTVTLTGAALGDIVSAAYEGIGSRDVLISANVQSTNTVRVVLHNRNGGSITFSDALLRVNIFKYQAVVR